jgi:predicted O-methyltransferase YrrM
MSHEPTMIPYGPVTEHVQAVLAEFPFSRDYCAGHISQEEYVARFEAQADAIEARLGMAHLCRIAARYPADFDAHAAAMFSTLVDEGFVDEEPEAESFEAFRETIRASYDHGENRTYIHPDEARVLYFLSMAKRPRRMIAIGAFYGYWAVWAMPGVAAADGEAMLIDPDPMVCALAEKNFAALGYGDRTIVHAEKAETVLPGMAQGVDLVLLDAAGSPDHPDPAYHSKGVYGFLIEDIFRVMADGALLVVHNDDLPGAKPLERFHAFCRVHFKKQYVARTPEGFGAYIK